MAAECTTSINASNSDISNDILKYNLNVKASLSSVIGSPSTRIIENIRSSILNNKDRKLSQSLKRQLKIEINKHKVHVKFYDYMVQYFMESGRLSSYSASPQSMADAWQHYFARQLHGKISPLTILQGPHRVKSLFKMVKRVNKQRQKMMKNSKLQSYEIALYSPDHIMMKADRFGIVSKLVNDILRVTDSETQMAAKFADRFKTAINSYTDNLQELISGSVDVERLININNAAMDGISGFNIKITSSFLDKSFKGGDDVLIVKEGLKNHIPQWQIKIKKSQEEIDEGSKIGIKSIWSDETYWLPKTELAQTEADVYQGLVRKYKDELLNDILSGQVRYLAPKILPPMEKTEDPYIDVDKNADYIRGIIFNMKRDSGTKRRTPGLHTTKHMGWEYTYVLAKQPEGVKGGIESIQYGEQYYVYLLNKKRGDEVINFLDQGYTQDEVNAVIKEGFYKSDTQFNYGHVIEKDGNVLHGADKRYVNFELMEDQPNKDALLKRVKATIKTKESYTTFWETVHNYRSIYENVFTDVESRVMNFTKKTLEFRDNLKKEMIKKNLSKKEIDAFFENFDAIGGIRNKLWTDQQGNMWSINSFLKKQSINYSPIMFNEQSLDIMIDNKIEKLEQQLVNLKDDDTGADTREIIEQASEHLKLVRTGRLSPQSNEEINKLVSGERLVHMKHITDWTDMTMRNKDGSVPFDYLKHTYKMIARNELMMEAVSSMHKLVGLEKHVPQGTFDYMLNRLKMGIGESDTRALNVFGHDRGYKAFADRINRRIPKAVRMGVDMTPESAEKLTKWIGAFPTMRFLGASSALGNRTQIVNMIIAEGFRTWNDAQKFIKENPDKAKAIIANTGVLNLLSMFQDIMLEDGEVEWNQFPFVPKTLIPSTNMVNFVKLLSKGRESFINNKDKNIDKFLTKLYLKSLPGSSEKSNLKYLIDLEGSRKNAEKVLKKKRGEMFDVFTLEEGSTEDIIKARYRKLVGEISETKLKQMVSWKLSWWWKGAGQKIFTFTAGEEQLRKETAIIALIGAYKRGLLGGKGSWDEQPTSIYMTPNAVKIARDAVYNTQFGMTPVYLGEGFNGFGRAVWQYKSYPTQQMAHDYKVFRKMTDGSDIIGQSMYRMTSETFNAMKRLATGVRYDPRDESIDHEALAAVRLVWTRGIASLIASSIGVIPIIGWTMRIMGSSGFSWSLLRSAENPAIGMMFRIMIWGSLAAMGGDEEDDALDDLLGSMQYLILPVFIGMLARDAYTTGETLTEWFN